jgi:hypothetical protein
VENTVREILHLCSFSNPLSPISFRDQQFEDCLTRIVSGCCLKFSALFQMKLGTFVPLLVTMQLCQRHAVIATKFEVTAGVDDSACWTATP